MNICICQLINNDLLSYRDDLIKECEGLEYKYNEN